DLVEGGRELAVAVVDQAAHAVEQAGEAEVARLLGHPSTGGISRAAGEMGAPGFQLNEEEHVEAAQRERLDGEEVAGEHRLRLLAQELPPARARAPRRGALVVGKKDEPARAGRLQQ